MIKIEQNKDELRIYCNPSLVEFGASIEEDSQGLESTYDQTYLLLDRVTNGIFINNPPDSERVGDIDEIEDLEKREIERTAKNGSVSFLWEAWIILANGDIIVTEGLSDADDVNKIADVISQFIGKELTTEVALNREEYLNPADIPGQDVKVAESVEGSIISIKPDVLLLEVPWYVILMWVISSTCFISTLLALKHLISVHEISLDFFTDGMTFFSVLSFAITLLVTYASMGKEMKFIINSVNTRILVSGRETLQIPSNTITGVQFEKIRNGSIVLIIETTENNYKVKNALSVNQAVLVRDQLKECLTAHGCNLQGNECEPF